jgi:hypothetical protein
MKKLALTICGIFIAAVAFMLVPTSASANYNQAYQGGYGGKKMVYKTAYKKPIKKTYHQTSYGRGGYYHQASNHAHVNAYNTVGGYGRGGYHSYHAQPDGKVLLTWDQRGGATCNIAYTEARGDAYQYRTAAGCQDGAVVIGGLEPGMTYKFAVNSDNSPVWYGEQPSAQAVALY